jgi:hypothetical protein
MISKNIGKIPVFMDLNPEYIERGGRGDEIKKKRNSFVW